MTTYWLLGENGGNPNNIDFGDTPCLKQVVRNLDMSSELSVVHEESSSNGRGEQAILLDDTLPLDIRHLKIHQDSENL